MLNLVWMMFIFIEIIVLSNNAPETLSNVSGAFFAYAFAPAGTLLFFSVEGIAFSGSPTT